MKIFRFKALAILALFVLAFSGCKKEDVSPNSKLKGTWKINSISLKDTKGAVDFWVFYNAAFPCTKEITMSFSEDGKYLVNEPSGCVDEEGNSYFILSKNGTFNLKDEVSLDIIEDDSTPYQGKVVFADGKFTWSYDEMFNGEPTTLSIVFTAVK